MNIENLTTVESLDQFLQGNQAIAFSVLGDKTERYQFTHSNNMTVAPFRKVRSLNLEYRSITA
jgi:hypothetical protein